MSNNMSKTREMLVNNFIEALEQEQIPWICEWNRNKPPKNAVSNTYYNGVNRMLLTLVAEVCGYNGNRWCTFNQIADKDQKYHQGEQWHLKKGSKGVPVEYWYAYNLKEKKAYSWEDYRQICKDEPERANREFTLSCRTYLVFNEDCIEGISKEYQPPTAEIDQSEIINNIITNMQVGYNEKGDKAYYSPINDEVVIPSIDRFKSDYGYYSTQLHELCHATGHSSRLNRDMTGCFGSTEYAKEELRAEISSAFLMQELGLKYDESHIDNHTAYIQNWISVLKKEPNELFRAIKDADGIVDYVKEKAEINLLKSQNISTIKVGNQVKSYFQDEKAANEFANKVNGKVYPVDFLGGYEVYYQPEKSNDDFDIEMGG